MKWLNRIISIFLIGLSTIICLASVKLGIGQFGNPGPGLMPFFTSLLLFLLSTVVLIHDFIGLNEGTERKSVVVLRNLREPIGLILALFGYTFLLNKLGYLITTFFLILFMFFINDPNPKKWFTYSMIGVIITNLTFLVFGKWLQMQLPIGIFHIGY